MFERVFIRAKVKHKVVTYVKKLFYIYIFVISLHVHIYGTKLYR